MYLFIKKKGLIAEDDFSMKNIRNVVWTNFIIFPFATLNTMSVHGDFTKQI